MDIIGNNAAVRRASGATYGGSAYDFTDALASIAEVDLGTWVPINQVSGSRLTSEADCSGVLYGYIDDVNRWRIPVIETSWTRKPDRAMGEKKKEVAFDTFEEILEDAS